MALGAVATNLAVTLIKGTKNVKLLPIEKCGFVDWTIFTLFVMVMLLFSYVGLKINMKEQALK